MPGIELSLLHCQQKVNAMKKITGMILLLAVAGTVFASGKPAYKLFNKDGREVKYAKMMKELQEADIIFFGELHTDPIAHWLQMEMTGDLFHSKGDALILGAEMFEADNQLILNEYLEERYKADKFEAEMRLWDNYQTDYKPLVEFAREHGIPFIATNIPRRYASMVHRGGFEALEELSDEAKAFMAPLPMRYDPEVKCYKDMLDMPAMGKKKPGEEEAMPGEEKVMPGAGKTMPGAEKTMPGAVKPAGEEMPMPGGAVKSAGDAPPHGMPAHGGGMAMPSMENLPKAQSAKDATMAYFILRHWTGGKTMFHFNGSYHSDNFEGIVWHILQERDDLNIMTIGTVLQEDISTLDEEHLGKASFILCVPESMTRTNR